MISLKFTRKYFSGSRGTLPYGHTLCYGSVSLSPRLFSDAVVVPPPKVLYIVTMVMTMATIMTIRTSATMTLRHPLDFFSSFSHFFLTCFVVLRKAPPQQVDLENVRYEEASHRDSCKITQNDTVSVRKRWSRIGRRVGFEPGLPWALGFKCSKLQPLVPRPHKR